MKAGHFIQHAKLTYSFINLHLENVSIHIQSLKHLQKYNLPQIHGLHI